MDFEVAPAALRRAGARLVDTADGVRGDLTASYHVVAPDAATNDGWLTTGACAQAVTAADAALRAVAGQAHDLGDLLRDAARGYERADDAVARRLGW
jgi:hypothetical protein